MADRKLLVFNADLGLAEEQQKGDVATANGPVDFGANPLRNVADPSQPQDVATKAYVDAHAGSGGGGDGGIGSGIILGRGAPTDPPPAANYLFFDLESATVYPAV
jgi:hypothetical protein